MKILLVILLAFCMPDVPAQTGTNKVSNMIREDRFVHINGIEQWITIHGDSTKPAILFLHGGPGSPISPYADAIFGDWEKDFVLVQWDQRGSGRTYGRNAPEKLSPDYLISNALTVDQMMEDGIELAKYLLSRLGKQKLILFGTSWGSVLGAQMALKSPELFYAYIGHAQMVHPTVALLFGFEQSQERAQRSGDQKTLETLSRIGKPPYASARDLGQLMRIVKKTQQENAIAAPEQWQVLSPDYNNEQDNQHRSDGDDFSFVNYAGDKKFDVLPIYARINFLQKPEHFRLPVYIIQGEEDLQTPAVLTRQFLDGIKAPAKEYFLINKTGHEFNQPVLSTIYNILQKHVMPLTNQ